MGVVLCLAEPADKEGGGEEEPGGEEEEEPAEEEEVWFRGSVVTERYDVMSCKPFGLERRRKLQRREERRKDLKKEGRKSLPRKMRYGSRAVL
jgi:hypothetical protein